MRCLTDDFEENDSDRDSNYYPSDDEPENQLLQHCLTAAGVAVKLGLAANVLKGSVCACVKLLPSGVYF